jgi:hypothetical protein
LNLIRPQAALADAGGFFFNSFHKIYEVRFAIDLIRANARVNLESAIEDE